MRRLRPTQSILAVALAVAMVTAPLVHGQSSPRAIGSGLDGFQAWLDLARRHVPGRLDDGIVQQREIPLERHFSLGVDLDALLEFVRDPDLSSLKKGRRSYSQTEQTLLKRIAKIERAAGTTDSLLRKIALLESDSVMLTGGKKFVVVPLFSRIPKDMILSTDGIGLDTVVAPPNWRIARAAIDAMSAEPVERRWIHDWYSATTAYLFYDHVLAVIPVHVAGWQRVLPVDPEAWFHEGCLFEVFAGSRIQHAIADARRKRHDVDLEDRDSNLGQARRRFELALQRNPRHVEARVRLARVKSVQGEARAAVVELNEVLPELGSDRELLYFSQLFLGAAYESAGDRAEARTAYAEALNLFPRALSPRISRFGLDSPSDGSSGDALADLLRQERMRADDPWFSYHLGPGRFAASLAASLWAASGGSTAPGSKRVQ